MCLRQYGQLWPLQDDRRKTFWWLLSRCSPLPIPNREVKPGIADDTALVCGKVGRRQSSQEDVPFKGCPLFLSVVRGRPRPRCVCVWYVGVPARDVYKWVETIVAGGTPAYQDDNSPLPAMFMRVVRGRLARDEYSCFGRRLPKCSLIGCNIMFFLPFIEYKHI